MEHATMEPDKEMYETMLRVSKNMGIMYEAIQEEIEENQ